MAGMKSNRLFRFLGPIIVAFTLILLACAAFASQMGKAMNEADEALNRGYKAALASMPDDASRTLLRDGQRAWVQFRDAEVALHAGIYSSSKGGLFVNVELTEARAKQLKSIAARTSANGYEAGPE